MASFFEPLPSPPPHGPRGWRAPLWDRPSEGTLPAIVPVGEIVGRNDVGVAELSHLGVYPNGFTIQLVMLANPTVASSTIADPASGLAVSGHVSTLRVGAPREHPRSTHPRVGVRFADGRTAGRDAAAGFGHHPSVDDDGLPTEPVVRMVGGGGSGGVFQCSFWVFPLPPDGPLEIFVLTPTLADHEAKVVIDGATIRAAARQAKVIWT